MRGVDFHDPLIDPLTGAASRRLFLARADLVLTRAAGAGSTTALLVVDVDMFHNVNDELGQRSGDLLLIEAYRRIRGQFGPSVLVARFAGDQFVVVCEGVADAGDARLITQRLAETLAVPVILDSVKVAITAGIGVALAPPGELAVDELIRRAESALRRAKKKGLGGCEFYREGPDSEGAASRALRRALDKGEFRLVYQPKVSLASDRIVGVEALLRWQDPVRGLVQPLDFIPLAEQTGLIVPIGAWVIEEACRQARRWLTEFPERPAVTISVNVSVRQFGPPLVDIVARALASSDVPPASLVIEVTESILMADVEAALGVLRALAALGVGLSIDDFGTGYSSLAYLKKFPLDELKIDKSFVDGLGSDPHDTAIVAAVVSTAHALALDVVAEGVETVGQLQQLRTLGCDEAQGYYFARPDEPDRVAELFQAESAGGWLTDPAGVPADPAYRPPRVLVVEDDEDVRKLVAVRLSAFGFEVHQAPDGESGLAAALSLAPDCVLLDVVMPGLNGLEVCDALRADPRTSGCTILMLTANDTAADKVSAFSCGADDYIVKPFSPRDLVSRVHAAMRRRTSLVAMAEAVTD